MNGIAVVKAEILNKKGADGVVSQSLDKNGLPALILTAVAGAIPSKRTISGTYAQRQQIFEGGLYMVDFVEQPTTPEYGRTWQFNNLGEVKPLEVPGARKDLGEGTTITID